MAPLKNVKGLSIPLLSFLMSLFITSSPSLCQPQAPPRHCTYNYFKKICKNFQNEGTLSQTYQNGDFLLPYLLLLIKKN